MTISEKPFFTRRHIVGSAAVGLAASIAPAIAQGSRQMVKEELQNPVDKYPKPPFKKQSQPWPGVAVAIPGDLRDEKFCQELVRRAVEGLGGLDILVSNAGRQQAHDSILDISSEDFDATIKTNIYAPFWIIKAALPHLKPGAIIIGTTSEQAYDPTPDLYDYAQTKAATMNYIKSLAKQLGPKGIRVNGVAPGPIWTPLQVCGGASMEKLQKFGGQTPLGRPGQPAELGSIYVQLAAADASFATGQVYGSAGGSGQP
jgi:NAD(P)-dependent dehydrogenase (short-subunit alcohol dehydrogenase family)